MLETFSVFPELCDTEFSGEAKPLGRSRKYTLRKRLLSDAIVVGDCKQASSSEKQMPLGCSKCAGLQRANGHILYAAKTVDCRFASCNLAAASRAAPEASCKKGRCSRLKEQAGL